MNLRLGKHVDHLKVDENLRREADELLAGGLRTLLGRYGKVHIQGSYRLHLMTWRDLDIHLESPDMSESNCFTLGAEICQLLRPHKMFFTDNRNGKDQSLPQGMYWGIRLGDLEAGGWKIDLWMVQPEICLRLLDFADNIASRLTPLLRERILAIKLAVCHHPEYRKSLTSSMIYDAVLDGGAITVEDFFKCVGEPTACTPSPPVIRRIGQTVIRKAVSADETWIVHLWQHFMTEEHQAVPNANIVAQLMAG